MADKSVKLKIFGQVQGVGYRYYCVRQAQFYQIYGYARNMSDDTVEVEAEGDEESLKAFIRKLESGPAHAEVEKIEINWLTASSRFKDFYILS